MKIIITGGAGFIGSNLTEFLLSQRHEIILIDDLSSGKLANIISFIDRITFINKKLELVDLNLYKEVDAVIHLAAQVSVPRSISHFKQSSKINLLCSISVIDFCSINKIPLIYASSSALYGNLGFGDDQITKVDLLSPYAVDKYALELYCKTAYKLHKLSSVGLRFFNVYGPKQDPSSPYSGVISIFIDRLLNNKLININGGHQTRDFIYVADVVNSINNSLMTSLDNVICEQVNVLTGNSISIDTLLDTLMRLIDCDVERIYKEMSVGDPIKSSGTTIKMENLLKISLSSQTNLDDGLQKTIRYIQSTIGGRGKFAKKKQGI